MSDEETHERGSEEGSDDHRDLKLRDETDHGPSWLSTYGSSLFRVAILVVLLAALVVLRKPCADGMAGFVGNFGQPPVKAAPRDGGVAVPGSGDAAPRH